MDPVADIEATGPLREIVVVATDLKLQQLPEPLLSSAAKEGAVELN